MQQAGDREALAAAEFHAGVGAANGQCRDGNRRVAGADLHRALLRELADLRAHVQADSILRHDRGDEGQGDPVLLELDGDGVVLLPTGMGNSPPTRKLAVSPLIAVRFGSASTLTRLSLASASIRAFTFGW